MDKDQLKSHHDRIIKSFEESVNESDYWKSIDEISQVSGSSATQVTQVIKNFDEFVENNNNKFTTKNLYKNKTPFFTKFIHSLKNKID